MACIIDNKYVQEYESSESYISYEMNPVDVNTLRFIEGYFYKAWMVSELRRWHRPRYGLKGKYQVHWSKLGAREMKKACYLDNVGS